MESYNIGRVFSRTVGQLRANFWTLLGFVAITYIALTIVSAIAMVPLFGSMFASMAAAGAGSPPDPQAALGMLMSPAFWLSLIFLIMVVTLGCSAMYAGAFHILGGGSAGQKPSLGECFSVGFKRAFPLFLTMLLVGLGVAVGYVLLIIPGIILALMWSVAMPASVFENLGPMESLRRSNALTKGSKGGIFLTYLAVFALIIVLELILFSLMGGSMMGLALSGGHPSPAAIGGAIGGLLLFQVFAMIFGILVILSMMSLHVSIYREVKLVKEGSDSGLADVFR